MGAVIRILALAAIAPAAAGIYMLGRTSKRRAPGPASPDEYTEPVPMAAWDGLRTGKRYDLTDREQATEALYQGDAAINDVRRANDLTYAAAIAGRYTTEG